MDKARTGEVDLGYRWLTDDELARCGAFYRRRRALLDEEVPPALRADAAAWYDLHADACAAEEARRRRAATLGVPRDAPGYPPAFLTELKARVRLDDLLAHEFGARLGRANARGVRRGWCPVCKPSDRSTALAVHTGDADDQWFYCHRCGVHGDAYAAIQIAYGLPFREAVAKLAALGGMPLPEAAPTRSAPRPSAAAWRPFEYRPAREVGR
ncbi:MAG TPA: CHC2 zinc finger domain-containing protein [Thermomicrobiales bacterium]|nr:CHC2 zinc finger domain-containing protein [Thermomicrobiales bacterium]